MQNNTDIRSLTPIIKAVGNFCNLRCSYCFYSRQEQSRFTRMSTELLEKFIRQYFTLFQGNSCFVWHGGEPLLAGREFYETAIDLQSRYSQTGQTILNQIQTNATLIDDQWADLFKRHRFQVGVSIDGDEMAHDAFRFDTRGQGSFSSVRRGIETLDKHGIRFGVVLVLNKGNARRMPELFRYLVEEIGARSISINSYVDNDEYSQACRSTLEPGDLANAVEDCLAHWPDVDGVQLREFENALAGAMGRRSRACTFNGGCRNYFCLNYDGGVYPCDSFTNNPDMRMGNIDSEPLEEILFGAKREQMLERFAKVPPVCETCEWHPVCNNGCPSQRQGGVEGHFSLCADRKKLFDTAREMSLNLH